MQGLIDQVLQADGVTPEMMQAQRDRVKLVETFMQASEDTLPNLSSKTTPKSMPNFSRP